MPSALEQLRRGSTRARADTPQRQSISTRAIRSADWAVVEYALTERFGEQALRQQLWETLVAGRVEEPEPEEATEEEVAAEEAAEAAAAAVAAAQAIGADATPGAIEYIASVVKRRGELWASLFRAWCNDLNSVCSFAPFSSANGAAAAAARRDAGEARRVADVDWGNIVDYDVSAVGAEIYTISERRS